MSVVFPLLPFPTSLQQISQLLSAGSVSVTGEEEGGRGLRDGWDWAFPSCPCSSGKAPTHSDTHRYLHHTDSTCTSCARYLIHLHSATQTQLC
jgi:hypothetical protein